jgi:DNA-binding CsgD family transcriptional regulator
MTDRAAMTEKIVEELMVARQPEDISNLALRYFQQFDMKMCCYHHLPPLGALDQGVILLETEGFPDAILERYKRENLFLIDPIPAYAQKSSFPFRWADIGRLTVLKPDQIQLMRDFRDSGLVNVYAFQVFGPGSRNGVFGLGLNNPSEVLKPATTREIHWFCQLVHLQFCETIDRQAPEIAGLSRREREVLEWVARGKSNADIATIMGVSSHTVDAYLRRVFLKLGTTDRVTAAIRGAGSGLITGVI